MRAFVKLAEYESPATNVRNAASVAVWTANRVIRFARGAVVEQKGRARVLFEVPFAAVPSTTALCHALSALSVACRLFGGELPSLGDEETARRFLAVRGVDFYEASRSSVESDITRKTARRQNDGRSNRSESQRCVEAEDGNH